MSGFDDYKGCLIGFLFLAGNLSDVYFFVDVYFRFDCHFVLFRVILIRQLGLNVRFVFVFSMHGLSVWK